MGTGRYLRNEVLYRPLPYHITSTGRWASFGPALAILGTPGLASVAWPSNNLAVYYPVSIPAPFTIARFIVVNGDNATGNVDVGIYNLAGSRLLSTGSTARSGTNVAQYIGVTDQQFPAGDYYLALVGSSTTGTYQGASFANAVRASATGAMEEALGATTLPSTMTPAAYGRTGIFHFGFSQSDTY